MLLNERHVFKEFINGFLVVLTELKCPMIDILYDGFMFSDTGWPVHGKELINEFNKLSFENKSVLFDEILKKFINFLFDNFNRL